MNTTLFGIHTGAPGERQPQSLLAEQFAARLAPTSRRQRAMELIFDRVGVGYRHVAKPLPWFYENHSTETRNDSYMDIAVPLGEAVIREGLSRANVTPEDIDDLLVVSCTGINVPGLDLHLAGRLGMRHNLRRTCVLGMGCYGAFPAIQRARQAAQGGGLALVLALELCTLHLQHDATTENVVSSALFADGASMALLGGGNRYQGCGPRVLDQATHSDYTTLDHMSFTLTDHGFRMYLSSYVPDLLQANVVTFVDALLARNRVERDAVSHWGVHPGSTKIIDYVGEALGVPPDVTQVSHDVLYEHGNMSSATILFVLERIQQERQPKPGEYGVLLAFGPGLTMEGMLLQW